METKFTPGPWYVDFDGKHYNVESEYCGEVVGFDGFYSHPERDKANSALCAAAPELYGHLCHLRDQLAFLKGDDYQLVVDADKILAKARGEL